MSLRVDSFAAFAEAHLANDEMKSNLWHLRTGNGTHKWVLDAFYPSNHIPLPESSRLNSDPNASVHDLSPADPVAAFHITHVLHPALVVASMVYLFNGLLDDRIRLQHGIEPSASDFINVFYAYNITGHELTPPGNYRLFCFNLLSNLQSKLRDALSSAYNSDGRYNFYLLPLLAYQSDLDDLCPNTSQTVALTA